VELSSVHDLYEQPRHPYTRLLLEARPNPNPTRARASPRRIIAGEIPSPSNPPSGCRFHPRCPSVEPRCRSEEPKVVNVGGVLVACHRYAG